MLNKLKQIAMRYTSRTTVFCGAFFVMGHIAHFLHRLDSTYLTFMGILLGYVAGHAAQENYFANKQTPPTPQS